MPRWRVGIASVGALALGLGLVLSLALVLRASAAPAAAPLPADAASAVLYAQGLAAPVDITNTGLPGDLRLFVVEQAGRIKIIQPGGVVQSTPFLDIDSLVTNGGGEQGLLGLAFSPNYAANRHFFVYYVDNIGDLQLSRFSANAANPNLADPTETKILNIPHPGQTNHNGGDLAFGPDGFLSLAPGDGGGGGDPLNNAQNITGTLLGKMLRLNVTGVPTYTIPITNPYAGATVGRDEIWASGLRNPFRFTFDRLTGDLYIGDVGQNLWEEINHQPANAPGGRNYGWRCYEGNAHPFITNGCQPIGDYTMPVAEYCNTRTPCSTGGTAVAAGYVYRGQRYPNLYRYFFYADTGSSRFWALEPGTWATTTLSINNVSGPSSFGEDVSGELYVAALFTGRVYCIVGTQPETPLGLPTRMYMPYLAWSHSNC